jgi:lipoprotein-releasing system ATP-binding protein
VSIILETKELTKTFRQGGEKIHAVKSANFEMRRGERVFIHGASGAGKSTLLEMVGALMCPTSGKVVFDGKKIYNTSDRKRSALRNKSFGFIFQFYHLLPELNVLENVMMPAIISGKGSRKNIKLKAKALLEKVGISHREKHKPGRISGGEAQRAAIARALVNEPDILFCDEPTGNLDSARSKSIYETLYNISEENSMSIMVVSHQDVPEDFFHSKYCMSDGEIIKED